MEIKKKKRVLLENVVFDWLQIWTMVSSLDVKSNKVIKKIFVFLANWLVFPNNTKTRGMGQNSGGGN